MSQEDTKFIAKLLNDTRKGVKEWARCSSSSPFFQEFATDNAKCNEALFCVVGAGYKKALATVARVRLGAWEEETMSRYWMWSYSTYLCSQGGDIVKELDVPEAISSQLFDEARLSAGKRELSVLASYIAEDDAGREEEDADETKT